MKIQVIACPNCNGEVQIDDSREFGFCTYCGTKVAFSREGEVNATRAYKTNIHTLAQILFNEYPEFDQE